MLNIKIDCDRNFGFIYRQIYEEIRELIMNGKLQKRQQLPSKRSLAIDLNVSINSVATAYEQLIAEGYLYAIEKSGYYVEDIKPFLPGKEDELSLPEHLKETKICTENWVSFSHITTNISLFPFKKWMSAENFAIKNYTEEIYELNHPQGLFSVRESIRDLVSITRGVTCFPEQIVIGPGTMPLINQIIDMSEKDIKIAIEDPGYSRMYNLFKSKDLNIIPIPLDEKGIDIKSLRKESPDYVFVTPSHQFPTGVIMPISRRIELLNWAYEKENRFIIEDDYDSEFKYTTDNIPSLQSLDKNQKVIYCGTFSKTLLPSFRFSYLILPISMLEKYKLFYKDWIQGSNTLQLLALKQFIDSGEYSKHVRKMNHRYYSLRQLVIKQLGKVFGEQVRILDIPAGLHFLVEFDTMKSYDFIDQAAKKERLELYDMRRFSVNSYSSETETKKFILGFANLNTDSIHEAVKRLNMVINSPI